MESRSKLEQRKTCCSYRVFTKRFLGLRAYEIADFMSNVERIVNRPVRGKQINIIRIVEVVEIISAGSPNIPSLYLQSSTFVARESSLSVRNIKRSMVLGVSTATNCTINSSHASQPYMITTLFNYSAFSRSVKWQS